MEVLIAVITRKTIGWMMMALLAPASGGAAVSFVRDVAPILVEQCLECHRADKSKGAYRLDHFDALFKSGDSEAKPVVPAIWQCKNIKQNSSKYKMLL